MTLAPLRVMEAADSMAKASTHEPLGKPGGPGLWKHKGLQLPAYIQHIAKDIMEKRAKPMSSAIAIAIGAVKRWARGGGNVDSGTQAAARKALAEWTALKASHGPTQASLYVIEPVKPSLADELAIREAALERIALLEDAFGVETLEEFLAATLFEAAQPQYELKRTASASGELSRHEVHDAGQHVGTITKHPSYGSGSSRFAARAVNGDRIAGETHTSQQAALDALHKHLEEAPARVQPHRGGKYLVARPNSYGPTTHTEYPSLGAARFAAGLPERPTSAEKQSQVAALGETLAMDLGTLSGERIPPLDALQEVRVELPLLAEAFSASELRDFRGRWRGGGAHHIAGLLPSDVRPTSTRKRSSVAPAGHRKAPPQTRYEGGVTRQSAKLRAAHAAKPQFGLTELPHSVGSGSWDKGAGSTAKRLLAQPVMEATALEKAVGAGKAIDTQAAHRTGPGGTYSKERQALHQRIIENLLQGKGVHEGKARAIFTAGGPASGKSGIVNQATHAFEHRIAADNHVTVPHDVVHANPDVVREMLPEYHALKAAGRTDASSLTHEEASHLAKLVTKVALGRQHHLLVDTVGDSGPGKFAGKIRDAQRAGHTVSVHYATVGVDKALARAKARGEKTGRFVPEDYLREAHRSVSERFPEIAAMPGVHVQVFDTSSKPSRLIAERHPKADKLDIKHAESFRGFLDKAKG